MQQPNKTEITNWFKSLQDDICRSLETLDGKATFHQDKWERSEGGGGRSRVIQQGNLLEKGGVNFSAVHGPMPQKILNALKLGDSGNFYATGVSIVLHPNSPLMPIIHMNVRYFEMSTGVWWFGGGIDLTPHYVTPEDATWFHQHLKTVCDNHDAAYYPKFKKWADDYFFIKHRQETRGVGGIFFDRLADNDTHNRQNRFDFVQDVGRAFVPIYTYFAQKYAKQTYTDDHKKWQYIRRSRYVEFNLVYDRGTKFGLDTNGRIESILMSMPPLASWVYNHQPDPSSEEAQTLTYLKKEIDWVNFRQ